MDLSLIAAAGFDWAWYGYLVAGILGLGLVILIHEFGHFAAAKLCGVRVEQFFIGFGPRLWSFHWGETEYGLRILPLGGFVSMFGQTDAPGKQAEEAERARVGTTVVTEQGEQLLSKGEDGRIVWHPRSYPAQTVPERMLIISAGVILNTITAFLFATAAYMHGAEFTPTTIKAVSPGGAAWQSDLRMGDAITQVEGISEPRFEADLRSRVALADLQKGLNLRVKREGRGEFDLTVFPRKMRPDWPPTLGIAGPQLTSLAKAESKLPPTEEGSPAHAATPKFESGDEIIKIEDVTIDSQPDVVRAQTLYADQPISVTVRRTTGSEPAKEVVITVAPRPWRTLGMTMQFGPIAIVQENSPASTLGIVPGDKLKSIDGEPLGDPITAAERLRRKEKAAPGKPWKLVLERQVDGTANDITLDIVPREADYYELPLTAGYLSLPTLGISYSVPPIVAEVEAGGPAAEAGVKPGDVFVLCKTLPTDEPTESGRPQKSADIKLVDNDADNWPLCAVALPHLRASTKIELTTKDGRKLTLQPVDSKDYFFPERGFIFQAPKFLRKASDLSQAFNYAYYDTRDSMTQVYRFLHAMCIGQIPTSAVGGVITIAEQAGESASGGISQFLLFLMMLSCNLAVLNFLPFPVLDGGHMVFLAYEGIFRRPPPQKLENALNLIGVVCLIFLMLYAFKNDIFRKIGWM